MTQLNSLPSHRIRWIQLPESGLAVQARVLVLPDPNLHAMLYVGHRLMGVVLARSRRCASSCLAGRHDTAHHGDADVRYQRVTATRLVHESHRRLDGRLSDIRIWCSTRICTCQLCVTLRLVMVWMQKQKHQQKTKKKTQLYCLFSSAVLHPKKKGKLLFWCCFLSRWVWNVKRPARWEKNTKIHFAPAERLQSLTYTFFLNVRYEWDFHLQMDQWMCTCSSVRL